MKKMIVLVAFGALVASIITLLYMGKRSLATDIVIDAPPAAVWRHFADFRAYPDWNPMIRSLSGDVRVGGTIEVQLQQPGSGVWTFSPVVTAYIAGSLLQWQGRLLMPGIFTGRHSFRLVPHEGGKTRFVHGEEFNGILVPFFDLGTTRKGFNLMNEALKKRVEKK